MGHSLTRGTLTQGSGAGNMETEVKAAAEFTGKECKASLWASVGVFKVLATQEKLSGYKKQQEVSRWDPAGASTRTKWAANPKP